MFILAWACYGVWWLFQQNVYFALCACRKLITQDFFSVFLKTICHLWFFVFWSVKIKHRALIFFLCSVYFPVSFTLVLHISAQQKFTNWSIIKTTIALVYLRLKYHLVQVSQEELRR